MPIEPEPLGTSNELDTIDMGAGETGEGVERAGGAGGAGAGGAGGAGAGGAGGAEGAPPRVPSRSLFFSSSFKTRCKKKGRKVTSKKNTTQINML